MRVKLSKEFLKQYKKANVRVRNQVDKRLTIFIKHPMDSRLNNHPLRDEYEGQRSIDITADWRAIYEEIYMDEEEPVTYFNALGRHAQLYGKKKIE